MTKIEEILNKYRDITRWPEYPEILENEYIQAMKEYAEWYAQKCLEIAESHIFEEVYCAEIYPTEIKLPPHD